MWLLPKMLDATAFHHDKPVCRPALFYFAPSAKPGWVSRVGFMCSADRTRLLLGKIRHFIQKLEMPEVVPHYKYRTHGHMLGTLCYMTIYENAQSQDHPGSSIPGMDLKRPAGVITSKALKGVLPA